MHRVGWEKEERGMDVTHRKRSQWKRRLGLVIHKNVVIPKEVWKGKESVVKVKQRAVMGIRCCNRYYCDS